MELHARVSAGRSRSGYVPVRGLQCLGKRISQVRCMNGEEEDDQCRDGVTVGG